MRTVEIPEADLGLLSGSAGWGIRFPDDLGDPAVTVIQEGMEFDTPFGTQGGWQLLEIEDGPDSASRRVLNVFSHGWPPDRHDAQAHQKALWILGQAGARKIVADSTCGSLNPAVRPGDFVISSDIIDVMSMGFSTLPGRFKWMCWGHQLICPAMAEVVESVAQKEWTDIGRVYGRQYELVAGGFLGPRFESPAEARAWRSLGADIINQSITHEAGLAREIGACFVSTTYVVNYVSGVLREGEQGLDGIHEKVGDKAVRISLDTLKRIPLDTDCGCSELRKRRPSAYAEAAK